MSTSTSENASIVQTLFDLLHMKPLENTWSGLKKGYNNTANSHYYKIK